MFADAHMLLPFFLRPPGTMAEAALRPWGGCLLRSRQDIFSVKPPQGAAHTAPATPAVRCRNAGICRCGP